MQPTDHDTHLLTKSNNDFISDLLRCVHITREFYNGFQRLRKVGNCVTIFGSARFESDHIFYQQAYEVAYALGKAGFNIMTGGGPGIMEAANKGAQAAGALSIGCRIVLPHELTTNEYTDIRIDFDYFFVRKVMLLKYSKAFVMLPGGFGTMDELFETATLMQTDKIQDFPVVLMGSEYWKNLSPFIQQTMLDHGTIEERDAHFARITDKPSEAVNFIKSAFLGQKI